MTSMEDIGARAQAYAKDYHNHNTTNDAFVACHTPHPHWAGGLGHGRYSIGHDVENVSTEETFSGATCSLTLLPRRPYREMFFANDEISVYLSTHSEDPEGFGVEGMKTTIDDNDRVFMGKIDGVTLSVGVGNDGAHKVRYIINCTGTMKVLDKTDVYYNELLGPNTLFGSMLPGLSTLTKNVPLAGTPATIPRAVALTFLGYGGQFLLPDSYPIGDGGAPRDERLNSFLKRSLRLEEDLGFLDVRMGVPNYAQREGVVQRLNKKFAQQAPTNAVTSIMDLFTYVEDKFVDGKVINSPTTDLTGSVWQLMIQNSNPAMNECFVSLRPTDLPELKAATDEWGQSPQVVPCLTIRERPFCWLDLTFEVPSQQGGQRRKLRFGDVAFASRSLPVEAPHLQATVERIPGFGANASLSGGTIKKTGLSGLRIVDRIKIRPQDILSEQIGHSDNDMFNFYMVNPSALPMSHVKYSIMVDGLIPIFLPRSIERHGLRVRDLATKFIHAGGSKITSTSAIDFLIRMLIAQDIWYQHNPYYLSGSFKIPGMPKARVGMYLDISGRDMTYYVEGVSHEWSHPGVMTTTLTVTRGQPSGFTGDSRLFEYAPPDSISVFGPDGKQIPRKKLSVQPSYSAPTVDKNDDKAVAKLLGLKLADYRKARIDAGRLKQPVLDYLVDTVEIKPSTKKRAEAMFKPIQKEINPPAMEDRRKLGDPPWVTQEGTLKAMHDPIRHLRAPGSDPGAIIKPQTDSPFKK